MARANEPIHYIVARQASAGAILDRFEIDLCAHGGDTLAEACATLQLSVEQVLERLEEGERLEGNAEAPDVSGYSLTRLIQHVVRVHHRYIREQLPGLITLGRKVRETHGKRAPELDGVLDLLHLLQLEMLSHFEREEQFLFPYIAQLDGDAGLAHLPAGSGMRSMAEGVFAMVQEHESVAHLLEQLQKQTKDWAVPEWACASYASFLAGLRGFQRDLERHLELENGMLFPRALELEAAVNAGR